MCIFKLCQAVLCFHQPCKARGNCDLSTLTWDLHWGKRQSDQLGAALGDVQDGGAGSCLHYSGLPGQTSGSVGIAVSQQEKPSQEEMWDSKGPWHGRLAATPQLCMGLPRGHSHGLSWPQHGHGTAWPWHTRGTAVAPHGNSVATAWLQHRHYTATDMARHRHSTGTAWHGPSMTLA